MYIRVEIVEGGIGPLFELKVIQEAIEPVSEVGGLVFEDGFFPMVDQYFSGCFVQWGKHGGSAIDPPEVVEGGGGEALPDQVGVEGRVAGYECGEIGFAGCDVYAGDVVCHQFILGIGFAGLQYILRDG